LPPPDQLSFPQDFITKMDAGDFDGNLIIELGKLTKDQLEELALILADRDGKRRSRRR
jgi:hypothetical protein